MVRASHSLERMILDLGQSSRVAVLTRQAAILIRGVRPSYGWLAGATPPADDRFDEPRLLGWRAGCRMLASRLAAAPEADSAEDPLLRQLADWVEFEQRVDDARWTHIRPVAMLGASVFEDLADRDDEAPEILAAWTSTLQWCLARCDTNRMEVDAGDLWLLDAWHQRAEHLRGGADVASLLASISGHARHRNREWLPAPFLRAGDVSLVQTLLEVGSG